jgi:hypothetical protein
MKISKAPMKMMEKFPQVEKFRGKKLRGNLEGKFWREYFRGKFGGKILRGEFWREYFGMEFLEKNLEGKN